MAPHSDTARNLIPSLLAQRALVATVESCTGGLVASRLTDCTNASLVFWGGWVAYQNLAKSGLLGLDATQLTREGAVSETTARRLAEAGLQRMRESGAAAERWFCLATTGVAGPSAGERGEPPGTCFVALAETDRATRVKIIVPGALRLADRKDLKGHFADEALDLLASALIAL